MDSMEFHGFTTHAIHAFAMLFPCNCFPHASMEKHGKYPHAFHGILLRWISMDFKDFHGIFPMLFPLNSMAFPCFFYQGISLGSFTSICPKPLFGGNITKDGRKSQCTQNPSDMII